MQNCKSRACKKPFVYPLKPKLLNQRTNTLSLFSFLFALLALARFLSLSLSFLIILFSHLFSLVWLLMSSLSLTFFTTTTPRVLVPSSPSNYPKLSSSSFSTTTARRPSTAVSFRSGARRNSARCPCVFFNSVKVRAMAKMVQDMESAVSSEEQNKKMLNVEVNHSRTFLDVRSEQGLVWFGFAL